jgi:hypothetical protein
VHTETNASGTSILSLLEMYRREMVVLRERILDASSSRDGELLSVVTRDEVRILRKHRGGFRAAISKTVEAAHVGFLGIGRLIAVALRTQPWLEIWDAGEPLVLVAATELPGIPTCMLATEDRIVLGLETGDLIFLRLLNARNTL